MDPGAPKNPKIAKKFLLTTLITTIIFAVIYYLVSIDLLRSDEDHAKKVYEIVRSEMEAPRDKPPVAITGRQGNVIKVDFRAMKEKLNGSA